MTSSIYELWQARIKEILCILVAAILPLYFAGAWFYTNTQLPVSDAANYLLTTTTVFHHFIDQGIWGGLHSGYFDRGWRPISFPVLGVPFLILAHGNLLSSVTWMGLTSVLANTLYVYLLLRFNLNRYASIIGASLIGLLPLLLVQELNYYSEAWVFFCLSGCVYHLIQSNYFRVATHTMAFVLLFAFAATLRPVETVIHLFLVLGTFLLWGCFKKKFETIEIAIVFAASALAIWLVAFFCAKGHFYQIKPIDSVDIQTMKAFRIFYGVGLGLTVLTCGYLAAFASMQWYRHYQSGKSQSLLIPAWLLMIALILAWFLPFSYSLFNWVYRTSFGDVAAATVKIVGAHSTIWNELRVQIDAEGNVIVGVTACMALLGVVVAKHYKNIPAILYVFLLAPLAFFEVLFTVQDINRKLAIAFPALIMVFLMLALREGRLWKCRAAIMTLLLGAQFSFLCYQHFYAATSNQRNRVVGTYLQSPITVTPNPHSLVATFLAEQMKKNNLRDIRIVVNAATMAPVDPFLLSTMIASINQQYSASYAYFPSYSKNNIISWNNLFHADGWIVSDNADRMKISSSTANEYKIKFRNETNPSTKSMYEFLYYYASNQLSAIGWQATECVIVKSAGFNKDHQRTEDCLACVFVPLKVRS